MDDPTVEVALDRIRNFVDQKKGGGEVAPPPPQKKKRWEGNLRLSFNSRIYDDSGLSPHLSSPHSPMAHSPMVRART